MGQRRQRLWGNPGWIVFAAIGLLTWYSCTGQELTAPSTGAIVIVTTTSGFELDPDGFAVSVDDRVHSFISPIGSLRHDSVIPGDHTVRLAGVSPNCTVQGENPLPVRVEAGAAASAGFLISCTATTGTVEVTTVTTGSALDSDGYLLRLDGGGVQPIGVSQSLTISGIQAGPHAVRLEGLASNCSVLVPNPQQLVVVAGQSAAIHFTVGCSPVASATHAGIMFGLMNLDDSFLGDVQTGTWRPVTPTNILTELAGIRARGARVILRLVRGDSRLLGPEGNFSLATWKSMVASYKGIDFSRYIEDGTVVGHYLIDEPHSSSRWGEPISQSTVESMAQYSKQLWPGMATMARVVPSWLAQAPIAYTHLDAGWVQYHSRRGDPVPWLAAEAAIAQRLGLGIVIGMNILDGGTSASGIPGHTSGLYSMSADELRRFGTAMLSHGYGCAFIMWGYEPVYYDRADIQSAMADLSHLARSHPSTSCRQ